MADLSDKLEIAPAVVVQVIYLHREESASAAAELHEFIDALNTDERTHLTAIAWVGRGTFEPEDYDSALETAYGEASIPTADYLMAMPDLAANLEAGLEALGVDVVAEEEDFL